MIDEEILEENTEKTIEKIPVDGHKVASFMKSKGLRVFNTSNDELAQHLQSLGYIRGEDGYQC
jgi:hypothetical protein